MGFCRKTELPHQQHRVIEFFHAAIQLNTGVDEFNKIRIRRLFTKAVRHIDGSRVQSAHQT